MGDGALALVRATSPAGQKIVVFRVSCGHTILDRRCGGCVVKATANLNSLDAAVDQPINRELLTGGISPN